MKISAIIQARMSSARLPGKVLLPLAGTSMLAYLFERLALCKNIHGYALATSDAHSDDPVADFCRVHGVACVRGPLDDVAARFLKAARELTCDAFIRINGDSPFMDQVLVDTAADIFKKDRAADLVTNVFPRTFPKGESIEVLRVSTLSRVWSIMSSAEEKEHITKAFYARPEKFKIVNFVSGEESGQENLCVDTPEDFAVAQRIVSAMTRPHSEYGWRDVLALKRTLHDKE